MCVGRDVGRPHKHSLALETEPLQVLSQVSPLLQHFRVTRTKNSTLRSALNDKCYETTSFKLASLRYRQLYLHHFRNLTSQVYQPARTKAKLLLLSDFHLREYKPLQINTFVYHSHFGFSHSFTQENHVRFTVHKYFLNSLSMNTSSDAQKRSFFNCNNSIFTALFRLNARTHHAVSFTTRAH